MAINPKFLTCAEPKCPKDIVPETKFCSKHQNSTIKRVKNFDVKTLNIQRFTN